MPPAHGAMPTPLHIRQVQARSLALEELRGVTHLAERFTGNVHGHRVREIGRPAEGTIDRHERVGCRVISRRPAPIACRVPPGRKQFRPAMRLPTIERQRPLVRSSWRSGSSRVGGVAQDEADAALARDRLDPHDDETKVSGPRRKMAFACDPDAIIAASRGTIARERIRQPVHESGSDQQANPMRIFPLLGIHSQAP